MGKGTDGISAGDNPMNRAYEVGYDETAAKFPHHRAASGLTKCEDTDEQKHVLYGALVGGRMHRISITTLPQTGSITKSPLTTTLLL